jgi:hypothetical protein
VPTSPDEPGGYARYVAAVPLLDAGDADMHPRGSRQQLDIEHTDESRHRDVLTRLTRSARAAGRRAVTSGHWLADTVVDLAPRIPIRDAATLSRHHDGLTGAALARSMIRSSGRVSATIGAATGGLVAVQELSVAGVVAVPFELAAETVLVVLVELKLVAELHQVAGRPLEGSPKLRVAAVVRSWLSGRGITAMTVAAPGRADLMGRAMRAQLTEALRHRFTRNLATLAPLMAGAALAGWLNRRATMAVGRSLADDLGLRR